MPTIAEVARHAEVSSESVLRFLNGEAVSVAVAERIQMAISALGEPDWAGRPRRPAQNPARDLAERLSRAAEELETQLPEGFGSVLYEAVRVEVRPVTEHMARMQSLIEELAAALARVGSGMDHERHERLQDLALVTDLIVTGWRTVDRRLARVERALERQTDVNERALTGPSAESPSGRHAGIADGNQSIGHNAPGDAALLMYEPGSTTNMRQLLLGNQE